MKTYIIAIDTNKGVNFIDEFNSEHGTSIRQNAKTFESKESAESFIQECGYENCYVIEND